jgi:hypothetical protein
LARFDHKLAVARVLERLGREVADLVGCQVRATDLGLCLQAAETGQAFGRLSRELFALRDGRAAGKRGDNLIDAVTNLLAEARMGPTDPSPAVLPLAA